MKRPLIIDIGTDKIKEGLADEKKQKKPRLCMPTVIGYPKYKGFINKRMREIRSELSSAFLSKENQAKFEDQLLYQRDYYVGHDAIKMRGVLSLKYPVDGIIRIVSGSRLFIPTLIDRKKLPFITLYDQGGNTLL